MTTRRTIPTGTKALTVRQPWASLIIEGHKNIENRSRPTKYRGLLAIHAGLKIVPEALDRYGRLLDNPDDLPLGSLLGTVELADCIEGARNEWAEPGYFHWLLEDPRPLARPIPARGALGFWTVGSQG